MIFQWWFLPYLVKQSKHHLPNKQNPKPSKKYKQKHTSVKLLLHVFSDHRFLFVSLMGFLRGTIWWLAVRKLREGTNLGGRFKPSITISGVFSPSHFKKYAKVKLDHRTPETFWVNVTSNSKKNSWSQGTGYPSHLFSFCFWSRQIRERSSRSHANWCVVSFWIYKSSPKNYMIYSLYINRSAIIWIEPELPSFFHGFLKVQRV